LRSRPETAELKLGETTNILLETKVKRPWVGLAKTLRLDVKPELSDRRLGTTDPATQLLAVKILPVVPLWLFLALLAILAALLAMLMQPQPIAHTDGINVVIEPKPIIACKSQIITGIPGKYAVELQVVSTSSQQPTQANSPAKIEVDVLPKRGKII
jgi:hypothetical protein